MNPLPRLYAILDRSCFPDPQTLFATANQLVSAGCSLLQYRNKQGSARQLLNEARELKAQVGSRAKLIMNDRADLCFAAGFDGAACRAGRSLSRSCPANHRAGALAGCFHPQSRATRRSRWNFGGLPRHRSGFRHLKQSQSRSRGRSRRSARARELTRKPLVAIGGITRANAVP